MTKKEKHLIYKIAKKTRKKLLKRCRGYSVSREVFKIETLAGYCYEASEALQLKLEKHKIYTSLIQGRVKKGGYHYWLEYKGNIIDLTACQFNRYTRYKFPLILVKPISRLKYFIRENII